MTYYEILGVDAHSNLNEIKSAYRKLVLKHHPDHGGSSELFLQINEAYENLSDIEKRKLYDLRLKDKSLEDDILEKNIPIIVPLPVSFSEMLTGTEFVIDKNLFNLSKDITISIPPGIEHNHKFVYKNILYDSKENKSKTLIFKVEIENIDNWIRKEDNLYTTFDISCIELIIGCEKIIQKPDNTEVKFSVKPNTSDETLIGLNNQGVFNINTNHTGRLYVLLKSFIPEIRNREILKKLRNINDEINQKSI